MHAHGAKSVHICVCVCVATETLLLLPPTPTPLFSSAATAFYAEMSTEAQCGGKKNVRSSTVFLHLKKKIAQRVKK